jgi:hypothetical protein
LGFHLKYSHNFKYLEAAIKSLILPCTVLKRWYWLAYFERVGNSRSQGAQSHESDALIG